MFTGLVEEMGTVISAGDRGDGFVLEVAAEKVLSDVRFGDSICTEGVCLSVTSFTEDRFTAGLAPETLARTHLGEAAPGCRLNLERSCLPTTRLGGHYVQGHVDGTGTIADISSDGEARWVRIACDHDLTRYIVPKGYICVDGASLTVVEATDTEFSLMLVSHTQPLITLGSKPVGARVNLEVDIMAKYAEKILERKGAA